MNIAVIITVKKLNNRRVEREKAGKNSICDYESTLRIPCTIFMHFFKSIVYDCDAQATFVYYTPPEK